MDNMILSVAILGISFLFWDLLWMRFLSPVFELWSHSRVRFSYSNLDLWRRHFHREWDWIWRGIVPLSFLLVVVIEMSLFDVVPYPRFKLYIFDNISISNVDQGVQCGIVGVVRAILAISSAFWIRIRSSEESVMISVWILTYWIAILTSFYLQFIPETKDLF